MAGAIARAAQRDIQHLFSEGTVVGLSDTQLLWRFAARGDEPAFAAILARHGPMVLNVCRGVLRNHADVEDALQATFLVLAKKANERWAEGELGGWLHRVAFRVAVRTSADTNRRRRHERHSAESKAGTTGEPSDCELGCIVHEEVARLPEALRSAIVACYFDGLTHAQAADRLQCGEATVRRRLADARERLHRRLSQRGIAPAAALMSVLLAQVSDTLTLPARLSQNTLLAATRVAAGETLAAVAGKRVSGLTKGVLSVFTRGSKTAALTMLSLAALVGLATGVGATSQNHPAPAAIEKPIDELKASPSPSPLAGTRFTPGAPPPRGIAKPDSQEAWPMSLAEAIRIAVDNSNVRVIGYSAHNLGVGGEHQPKSAVSPKPDPSRSVGMVIGRRDRDGASWRLKRELITLCRTAEERYWNLAQARAQRWASELAAQSGKEILHRETVELQNGRGTAADVAECSQRLEQFNLDVVTRASDVITSERQLRKVLGLPASDSRNIVPVSTPVEAKVEYDWGRCLAEMLNEEPEIAFIKRVIGGGAHAKTDQNETLHTAVNQRTHSLSRCYLEVDSNFKQFQVAARLRRAAADRLTAQRSYYEEGRITVDRYLDAVSQHATAVATESQYKTTYNISIVSLEEAKGTLLAFNNIAVVDDGPVSPSGNPTVEPTMAAGKSTTPTKAHEKTGAAAPAPTPMPAASLPQKADMPFLAPHPVPGPKVWNFSFSIGRDHPFVIKGTISEGSADPKQ